MEAHIGLGTDTRPHAMSAVLRDERLAWLIGKGSERAFTSLYHRYHQQLYRYCHSMLREDADAQDALQATFAAAFAALRDGRRDAPLRPWLFRIAHNEAITILRRRRSHSELPDELPAPANAIEEQAEHRERLRRLVADFRELPERQRAALLMRELSGLSHEEIAVALDTSVGTAKQTIYEARQALAEFEEGRMAACDEICRTISNGDRRALRARRIRAHLRECPACSAFAAAIPVRSADLRALAPALPPATTALLLSQALAVGVSGGSGSGAVGAGAAGKATLALSGAKVATTVALATTATIGVATVLGPHLASPRHTSGTSHLMRPAAERAGRLLPTPRGAPQRAALSSSAAGARTRATATATATATGTGTGTRTGTASVVRSGTGHAAVAPLPRTSPHRPNAVGATPTGGTTVPAPAPAGAVGTSNAGRSAHAHGGGAGKAAGAQPPPRASHGRGQQKSRGSSEGPQRSNPSPVPHIPNPAGVANGLVRGGPPVVHGPPAGNLNAHAHSA